LQTLWILTDKSSEIESCSILCRFDRNPVSQQQA
jgi:hypothetical protein